MSNNNRTDNTKEIKPTAPRQALLTNPLAVCLLAGICCLLWGSAFPCVKIGYALFCIGASDTSSQLLFAGCRFTIAGIMVLAFAALQDCHAILPRRASTWKSIIILSFFQTVMQYFFFYVGLAHTSGVKASIIEGTNVFVAILTASLVFRQEKLTVPKIAGCGIGFLGVVLVNLGQGGLEPSLHLTGEGFIFLSTFAYAFSTVLMKNFSQKDNPVLLSGWQFLIGGIALAAVGWLSGGSIAVSSFAHAAMLAYLAFISAGAYTLWGILMKYNPVSQVSVYGFMNPVFGVVLSFFLLHDSTQISWLQSIPALALVCMGIYIVNRD